MLTYFEERRTVNRLVYKVKSWRLLGFLLVFRRWEQLTVRGEHVLPCEKE